MNMFDVSLLATGIICSKPSFCCALQTRYNDLVVLLREMYSFVLFLKIFFCSLFKLKSLNERRNIFYESCLYQVLLKKKLFRLSFFWPFIFSSQSIQMDLLKRKQTMLSYYKVKNS